MSTVPTNGSSLPTNGLSVPTTASLSTMSTVPTTSLLPAATVTKRKLLEFKENPPQGVDIPKSTRVRRMSEEEQLAPRKKSRPSNTDEKVERVDFNQGYTELRALHLFHGPGPSTNKIEYKCTW